MGKNGGKPPGTILTLEQALRRFARKRSEGGAESHGETAPGSNVRYGDFSATVKRGGDGTSGGVAKPADHSASAQRDEANAGTAAGEDLIAVIDGVPRTLEELEQIAAAEAAYPEVHAHMRDNAFTAIAAAMAVLAGFLIMRVPIINDQPMMAAQTIATPALKASSPMSADDLIATWVIIPDTDFQPASAHRVKPAALEARIKDALKRCAFPDVGVSVSKMGDAYLAGEVYSLDEARRIAQIVHRVNGVNQVHFLHPDVRSADGPAYFGVTTARAPAVWGAKVQAVSIGSPADKAGIKPGDVISEFDGKTVPDAKAFQDILAEYSPGRRVQFRAWHNGQPEYLVARLREATTVASR